MCKIWLLRIEYHMLRAVLLDARLRGACDHHSLGTLTLTLTGSSTTGQHVGERA